MSIPDNIRYLVEALRTPAADASTTMQSGPRTGTTVSRNSSLGPLEQRRDGYRLYAQEKRSNDEEPLSYEEWIAQEQ